MQNNLNRWYDAAIGQWLSEDPIGFRAGDANLSRYLKNKPLTLRDPSGLQQAAAKTAANDPYGLLLLGANQAQDALDANDARLAQIHAELDHLREKLAELRESLNSDNEAETRAQIRECGVQAREFRRESSIGRCPLL